MKKPSTIKKIFSFLAKVVAVVLLMAVIAVSAFEGVTYYLTGSLYDLKKASTDNQSATDTTESQTVSEVDESNMVNTLFFMDSADSFNQYIALNMRNTSTHAMDILLIPQNAQITVSSKMLSELQKKMPDAKSTVDLEDVARDLGEDKYQTICDIISEMTGIKIAGYDTMTEKNFVEFANMAGKITYTLDNNMSYRSADGTLKELTAGELALTGEQGLIMMQYQDGSDSQESDRLERTSTYLESLMDNLLTNASAEKVCEKYAELAVTSDNRSVSDMEEVYNTLTDDAITIRIFQGSESDGTFKIDSQKVQLQIATLVSQSESYSQSGNTSNNNSSGSKADVDTEEDTSTDAGSNAGTGVKSSKGYNIELYNAAYVSGLAADWEAYLEEEGYDISLVDSYQEEGPISETRIIVTEEGMGEDLLAYFPDASIEVGSIDTGGDIAVYIGTDSTDVGTKGDVTISDTESDSSSNDDEDSVSADSYSFDTDSEE